MNSITNGSHYKGGPVWEHADERASGRLLLIGCAGASPGKLEEQLSRLGFEVLAFREGPEALAAVGSPMKSADVVVLDWRCSAEKDVHFAEMLARNATVSLTPVLTLAAESRPEDARLASQAGLTNHLSMPCQLGDLKGALLDVIARAKQPVEARPGPFHLEDAVPLLESCRFRFRTPEDIEKLVPLLARLFPEPDRTLAGISELMMNAIEHGNLEIGQERKADWIARGVYESELAKRLSTPPYSSRWGEVIINKREDGVMIVIMDQGCGFCWQDLINDQSEVNGAILEPNGRGIATAKDVSFDQLRFNHQGNQVTAFVSKENSW